VAASELDLSGFIIRDADLSQALSVAWFQQTIFGLSTEWGKEPIEVLQMQERFHRSFEFQTEWAREMFPPEVIEAKIDESKEFLEILADEPATVAS